MSKWKKIQPIEGGPGGCLNCGYQYSVAPMDMLIAVGFGMAVVTKNKEIIYEELKAKEDELWTVREAENEAKKDPDNDWRIILDAPLSTREYQRHGEDNWVLIRKGMGFA